MRNASRRGETWPTLILLLHDQFASIVYFCQFAFIFLRNQGISPGTKDYALSGVTGG